MSSPPRGPRPGPSPTTRSAWLWAAATVATLLLFAAMSWQAWTGRPAALGTPAAPALVSPTATATASPTGSPTASPTVTNTPTPTRIDSSGGLEVTPSETPAVAAAGDTTPAAEQTAEALVAAVLTRLPSATPTPAPNQAATATAQSSLIATVIAQAGSNQPDSTATLGLWLSAVSAISALIGLGSSALLGWRKERREAAQAQAELEKTRLEVVKLQRELEQVGIQARAVQESAAQGSAALPDEK